MRKYLEETLLLDLRNPRLVELVEARGWNRLSEYEAIGAIYDFVRNEIAFGYNAADDLPASRILGDGYGQCNTKGTLLMALLRSVGIPCRFHGFTIGKELQRGAIPAFAFRLAPQSIIHSWVEVFYEGRWINLEGFILDAAYLDGVRCLFPEAQGEFCGYAIGTSDIRNPGVEWSGTDTYIQRTGINHDYGVFESPDVFYEKHGANLSGFRRLLYRHLVRHWMNAKIRWIRRRPASQRLSLPLRGPDVDRGSHSSLSSSARLRPRSRRSNRRIARVSRSAAQRATK